MRSLVELCEHSWIGFTEVMARLKSKSPRPVHYFNFYCPFRLHVTLKSQQWELAALGTEYTSERVQIQTAVYRSVYTALCGLLRGPIPNVCKYIGLSVCSGRLKKNKKQLSACVNPHRARRGSLMMLKAPKFSSRKLTFRGTNFFHDSD